MPNKPCRIVKSSRQVIENKLLARLEDPATVAILANEQDLTLLIDGLRQMADHRALELAADLERLRQAAFKTSS